MTNSLQNLSVHDLARISQEFEAVSPVQILEWAVEQYGSRLLVTASFQNAVLAHMVNAAIPGIEITLLDTQYLFPETLQYATDLAHQFGLNIGIVQPDVSVQKNDLWMTNPDKCCELRKVDPLKAALKDVDAWVTGLRRTDSESRARTRILSFDVVKQKVKINPLAAMTDEAFDAYVRDNNLPEHPLTSHGFPSIGCWPCTRRVENGEDRRAGRWAGFDKTECGLHF